MLGKRKMTGEPVFMGDCEGVDAYVGGQTMIPFGCIANKKRLNDR